MVRNILYFLGILVLSACTQKTNSRITIHTTTPVQINGKQLNKNTSGVYTYTSLANSPTIVTLQNSQKEWELYIEPQKAIEITIHNNSLTFRGDLMAENKHLQAEKKLNDTIVTYLHKNWYSLHKKPQTAYLATIDSLKSVFTKNMKANKELSANFKKLNTASIDYAFDRMILRYPRFHRNFTGNVVTIPKHISDALANKIDIVAYAHLSSYKKFTKTWLDQKIQQAFQKNKDTSSYRGLIRTNIALKTIAQLFDHPQLQDYWSFEYIKEHIKQYTWINGKSLLEAFKKRCTTKEIQDDISVFENKILEKRKHLEIVVYKTVNNFKLEAYIYKPKQFDPQKKYAVLAAFHGGGWMVGDASFTITSAQHAAKNGLIGFSVEYRLSNREDVTPEEALQDTRDFIRWLRKHAVNLSIDPNRIIAKGVSAGGHLVAATAVLQQEKNSVPNALILVSPALETKDRYFKSLLRKGQNAAALSPLENLRKGLQMPPTLILQGKTDNVTPTRYAEAFKSKMDRFNYKCELVIYENCGHLFTPSHLDDTGWPQSDPDITRKAYQKQAEFYTKLGYHQEEK